MILSFTTKVLLGVILLLGLGLGVLGLKLGHANRLAADSGLRADSALAAGSQTQPLVNAAVRKALGDSATAWQRRTVQMQQTADALDKAVAETRIARAALLATVHDLQATARGAVTGDSGVRAADFHVRQAPFTVSAHVDLPPAPDTGKLAVTVAVDPASIGLRLYCGAALNGIRRADAVATGPTWLTLGISHIEQSPDLCRSPALEAARPGRVSWLSLTLGAGIDSNKRFTLAAILGPSVRVW